MASTAEEEEESIKIASGIGRASGVPRRLLRTVVALPAASAYFCLTGWYAEV